MGVLCAITEPFGASIKVKVPPPINAVVSPDAVKNPSNRDDYIADISAHGRMAWQKSSGYNQRSRIETQIGRGKTVIGPNVKVRSFENQKTEARIDVRALNRTTELDRPSFERNALNPSWNGLVPTSNCFLQQRPRKSAYLLRRNTIAARSVFTFSTEALPNL